MIATPTATKPNQATLTRTELNHAYEVYGRLSDRQHEFDMGRECALSPREERVLEKIMCLLGNWFLPTSGVIRIGHVTGA